MLSVEAARERILEGLVAVGAEMLALDAAWGRVTADAVEARLCNPPADVSAMDGYAVRSHDAETRAVLRLVGAAAAGHPFEGRVGPGECARIFTGALMPEGSDGVLIQENATRETSESGAVLVRVGEAVPAGRHVRPRGQDFATGETVIPPGRRLGARDIGVAAACGHAWIRGRRRPIIGVLTTGDELALPGEPIGPGGIVNSNAPMLAALVRSAGASALMLPNVPDRVDAIAASVAGLRCDMLVSIGGASVGDHDLVQAGLASHGFAVDFWKIAMRPGKPLMHGWLKREGALDLPVLGLPGNPVSALVCGLIFLLPAIARLSGDRAVLPEIERATLGAPLAANDRRADHLRAALTRDTDGSSVVSPFPRQDSGMLRRLAASEALILRPPNAPPAQAGESVEIIRLDRHGL